MPRLTSAKVYPFRLYEKVAAAGLLGLALIGFAPSAPSYETTRHDHGWQVCIAIGFIPEWQKCFWFPDGPKQLYPDVPECGTFVGPCQS